MATPVTNFLTTTELLEQMFLECDQQTLLTRIQRVCQRWRDIIEASPTLQAHLFRKPAPAVEGAEPVLNPLLVAKFPCFFARVQKASSDDGGGGGGGDVFYGAAQLRGLAIAADPEAYLRAGASWRVMHVRQPPLTGLGVARPMRRYSQRYLQDVKMGMLYDHVRQAVSGGAQEEEWRVVWGRVDALSPALELWGDYYEGIRRQLENEVDAVLILRSRRVARTQAVAGSDEDGAERDGEGGDGEEDLGTNTRG
ncbi:hypothetical protein PG999_001470 [Apiospora kogelbergensis]|uniref:F-box domain-containing protein n=1 Tax=Apiospora kogelbergensis TaxID=1337665 RepID=A0AAW0RES5_9PEZI